MPVDLLVQVDVLAKQRFASRSDILRQAALTFICQAERDASEAKRLAPNYTDRRSKPAPEPEEKYDYDALSSKYPYVYGDRILLRVLDDLDNSRL